MTKTKLTLASVADGSQPGTKLLTFQISPDQDPSHVGILKPTDTGGFQWLIDNDKAFADFVAGHTYLMTIEDQA